MYIHTNIYQLGLRQGFSSFRNSPAHELKRCVLPSSNSCLQFKPLRICSGMV